MGQRVVNVREGRFDPDKAFACPEPGGEPCAVRSRTRGAMVTHLAGSRSAGGHEMSRAEAKVLVSGLSEELIDASTVSSTGATGPSPAGRRRCPVCSVGVYASPSAPVAKQGTPNHRKHRCNDNATWTARDTYGGTWEALVTRLLETPRAELEDWPQVLALKTAVERGAL